MLEQINEEMDYSLDKALNDVKLLKELIKDIVGEDIEPVTLNDLKGSEFLDDGELSRHGVKMLIKAGMGFDDIQEAIAKGDEILEWLESKGIKLDQGGNLDKN